MLTPKYTERAAVAVLLWSELLDDADVAEACASVSELTTRRDGFRRELRIFAEARRPDAAIDKWVQRAFWSAPPKRGTLDDAWKETLLEWVRAMELGDAADTLELAVRALFADGARACEDLAARRPALFERVAELLGGQPATEEILRAPATLVNDDSVLPMYMTDRNLQRVVWCNRSLETFIGLARDQIIGMELVVMQGRFAEMMVPDEQASFLQRQEEVKVAGKNVGRAYIEGVVDMARRTWTGGQPTPPWEGRYRVHVNANFVYDRATNVRIGSNCVFFPVRLSS